LILLLKKAIEKSKEFWAFGALGATPRTERKNKVSFFVFFFSQAVYTRCIVLSSQSTNQFFDDKPSYHFRLFGFYLFLFRFAFFFLRFSLLQFVAFYQASFG